MSKINPKIMKKLYLLCLVTLLCAACTQQLPEASYDIIPLPKEVQLTEEKPFVLQQSTTVYYEEGLQREAELLSEYMNDIMGYSLDLKEYQDQPDGIVLKLNPEDFEHSEAYEITVVPNQIVVKGADAAGVFYGIQTLRKSLPITSHLSTPLRYYQRLARLRLPWHAP